VSPNDVLAACKEQQQRIAAEHTEICLILGGRRQGNNDRVRLFGRHGGPYGQIVGTQPNAIIAMFDAQEVIDWIENVRKAQHDHAIQQARATVNRLLGMGEKANG